MSIIDTTPLGLKKFHPSNNPRTVDVESQRANCDVIDAAFQNRLRIDGAQSFTSDQKVQGRSNLGLGSMAIREAIADADLAANSKIKNRLNVTYLSDHPTLAAAAAASNYIVVDKDFTVDANTPLGAFDILDFQGGILTIAADVIITLNVNSTIVAGRHKIFAGPGTITNLRYAMPEWWGAIKSLSFDNKPSFQAALDALRGNGFLDLDQGVYSMTGTIPLYVTNGQHICGKGDYQTVIAITTALTNFVEIRAGAGVGTGAKLSYFTVQNTSGLAPTPSHVIRLLGQGAGKFVLKGVRISICYNAFVSVGDSALPGNTGTVNGIELDAFYFGFVYNYGIYLEHTEGIHMSNAYCNGTNTSGAGMLVCHNYVRAIYGSMLFFGNSLGPCIWTYNDANAVSLTSDSRWFKFVNCAFDDSRASIQIDVGTLFDFVSCTFSSSGRLPNYANGYGAWLKKANAITFVDCEFANCGSHGIRLSAGIDNVHFYGCKVLSNNVNNDGSNGVLVEADVGKFHFHGGFNGNRFSSGAGLQQRGIVVSAGASNNYRIQDVTFLPNVVGAILDGGTGTNKVLSGNLIEA